jgi:hypothetical protein
MASLLFKPVLMNLKFVINPKIPPILVGLNDINKSMVPTDQRLW